MQPNQVAKKCGKNPMSEKTKEDEMLGHLTEDIDMAFMKWMNMYEVPALNMTAVVLARLTWLAKLGNYREDFLELLKAPGTILDPADDEKVIH
jgi:hypothetical protein